MTRRMVCAGPGLAVLAAARARSGSRTVVLGIGHAHAAGKVIVLSSSEDYELVSVCEPGASVPRDHKAYQRVRWLSQEEALNDCNYPVNGFHWICSEGTARSLERKG
jgi:hypothetical protein